jgi:hypothetical protein
VAPTITLSLTPSTVGPTYIVGPGAPLLTWSVTGGTSVAVTGNNLSSSVTSGSAYVCPGNLIAGACSSLSGTYDYTVTVYGPGAVVLATDSRTLTIL